MGQFIIIFLVVGIISALMSFSTTSDARKLSKNFTKIGNMSGKSYHDIKQIVGESHSTANLGNIILKQWIYPGAHIAIKFDKNLNFIGIQSQYWNC